jgi:epoxyqueuosine reductase
MAGEMAYLTDRRGDLRSDPRNLLATAQSILCVAKLYNTPHPQTAEPQDPERGWISRYAWGADYHDLLRRDLETLVGRIAELHAAPFDYKICIDTAPLLERSYARAAGLGWIGKNTCLINQQQGSWFFLAELLLSIPLAPDSPPPERCGTCTRCIDACPTAAIVPRQEGGWTLDARLCISYLTIEKRGEIPQELADRMSNHLFGCDICQDVCPWNRRAPVTGEPAFEPAEFAPPLDEIARLGEEEFRERFRHSPLRRTRHAGLKRNVAIALRNAAVLACLCLSALGVCAGAQIEDPLTDPGFVHFYNNEYDQALAVFEQQLKAHPNDPQLYNHLAQTILYREMLRNGALESQLVTGSNPFLRRPRMEISDQDKARFNGYIAQSMTLTAEALRKNPRDVQALYTEAVAHGLRANYLFLVQKAWLDSLHEITAARKADERALQIDPTFSDARLVIAINEYIVGCLPFGWRMIASLGGFHGDREDGIRQLQLVAQAGILNRFDARELLAAIYRRERQPQRAIPLVQALAEKFPRNYLFRFEEVEMYSDLGDKQNALRVLAEIEDLRRHATSGYAHLPAEKIQYLKANLLFWYGDLDPALADLKQVTRKADELDLNTAVMAWLRLGQVYDLEGNHKDAVAAYRETMNTAPKSEAAAEAKSYISSPYRRKRNTG